MKKTLLSLLAVLALALIPLANSAYSADTVTYTQDISSFPVATASATEASHFVCLVSSAYAKTYVSRIIVSASDNTAVQKVTLYDNCNSTTTATARFVVYTSTTNSEPIIVPFTDANPILFTRGIVARKSSPSNDVQVTIETCPAR